MKHFSLKRGFDGSVHVQATTLMIVYETIGSIQTALSGNLPFPGQSRKLDDTDIFKFHA